jgi:hypothetical protein
MKATMDELKSHLSRPETGKVVFADLEVTPKEKIPKVTFNINWERSLVSLSLIGLIYTFFV